MLLNCFAQPTLLRKHQTYLNFEEFKKAPLLLCHKNALDGKLLPSEWSGSMYGTHEALSESIKQDCTILRPNEMYNINMHYDEKCPYMANNIEITALPWDKENAIFVIKDDNTINLLTDIITEDMTIFVQNKVLRSSIKNGIDVLYVNDGVYHKSTEFQKYPSESLLSALVTLVRPRYVKGLLTEDQLPAHITCCCADI